LVAACVEIPDEKPFETGEDAHEATEPKDEDVGEEGPASEAESGSEPADRIHLLHASEAGKDGLATEIEEIVEPGSTIRTDGLTGYDLDDECDHERIVVLRHEEDAFWLFPTIHTRRLAS